MIGVSAASTFMKHDPLASRRTGSSEREAPESRRSFHARADIQVWSSSVNGGTDRFARVGSP